MPIDSSIYFQQQPLDIAGAIDRGLSMRQMLDQRKKQQDMQDAYKAGIVQQPDGTSSFNSNATISDLAKRGYGQEAMALQKQANEDALNKQKLQKEKNLETANFIASAAPKVKENPQAYYPVFLAEAKNRGLDTSPLPPVWNDDAAKKMDYYHGTALSLMDQHKVDQDKAELGLKQQEFGLKQTGQKLDYGDKAEGRKIDWAKVGIDRKKAEADANKKSGSLEGQKALDRDYAKDYNDWTSTSRNALDKNLQRLENAKAALQSDPSLTGSIRGTLPDFIRNTTNEKAISVRDEVRAAAQGALKATLGSAFTEKEGERIMNQAYNEKLSPEENIRKIDQAIAELLANKSNNDKKAMYFQKNGTLNGLDILSNQQNSSNQQAPKTVRMTDKSGRIFDVPAELYGEAIAAGASKVKQ